MDPSTAVDMAELITLRSVLAMLKHANRKVVIMALEDLIKEKEGKLNGQGIK